MYLERDLQLLLLRLLLAVCIYCPSFLLSCITGEEKEVFGGGFDLWQLVLSPSLSFLSPLSSRSLFPSFLDSFLSSPKWLFKSTSLSSLSFFVLCPCILLSPFVPLESRASEPFSSSSASSSSAPSSAAVAAKPKVTLRVNPDEYLRLTELLVDHIRSVNDRQVQGECDGCLFLGWLCFVWVSMHHGLESLGVCEWIFATLYRKSYEGKPENSCNMTTTNEPLWLNAWGFSAISMCMLNVC